ncbi:MAG: endonuclease/exonuclease/phosphatase family protein [Sumerlaeia bacterium]
MTSGINKSRIGPDYAPEPPPASNSAPRYVIFFTGLTAAASAILAAAYLIVSDRTAWGEFLTIWPPVLWLFGLLPLALLSCHRRRGRLGVLAFACPILFLALAGEWRSLVNLVYFAPEAPFVLQVGTWNMGSGYSDSTKQLREMAAHEVDLWLLQETPDHSDAFSSETLTQAGLAGFHAIDAGDCAVLSRWPVRRLESQRVGPWEAPLAVAVDLSASRTLVVVNARLMLPSLELNPFSSRARDRLAADHAQRIAQFPRLVELANRHAEKENAQAAIVGGDFNTPGRMWSVRAPLRGAGFRDVWREAGAGWPGTMTADFPVARIDQLWARGALRPTLARVHPADGLSDHRPLLAELAWEGETSASPAPQR